VTYSGGNSEAGAMAMAAAAGGAGEAQYAEDGPPAEPVQQRVVDESEQIGRNDPCWCGSGKKYKKCHGA
ncbi:MAG TPA: SEC-C metal-binding domain-containing protein, partial [Solirubrobacteraceae bacterium]|nr:SEC-C metal-binding domain-containing protein [Solirubrobacteraceae bacterium]